MTLIRLYILLAILGGEIHEGYAPHYARNLMDRVAAHRGLGLSACMVSSPRYTVGAWVWVWGVNTRTLRHCQVVDVSHPRDKARHLRTGREVELSYEVALDLCGNLGRPTDCPVITFLIGGP